ncbi:Hexokinase isoenzyme 2 [Diatrype stigma]|uniref:Phosphotransferase n=1 Tax=Diatrype stigma TaxID=117547 RepID=A0AAN9UVW3_9PEZI
MDGSALAPGLQDALASIEKQFTVDTTKLKQISKRFEEELREGLERNGANIAMNVTWVLGFPTGDEKGQYLTVDLGGTNLRTCMVTLRGRDGNTHVDQELTTLPDGIKTGTSEQLWSLVADSIAGFLEKRSLPHDDEPVPLGFTFSYPAMQDRIDHGELTTWTKGFDIEGVEGQDVVKHLGDAMKKRNLPVRIVSLINDTTGAMIASAYNDPATIIGAIFGTGCNAAYMDNVDSIPKLNSDLPAHTPIAINCEYGAFDNAHRVLPRTKYDEAIDAESPRPGEQAFEKMSAGLYLGEIYRQIMCDFYDRGLVFTGNDVSELRKPYRLDTGFLSSLENDKLEEKTARFESALGFRPTEEEMALSQRLAEIIALRGARLCTCGVAAICRMKGIRSGHVAADGAVANKHPTFRSRWAEALGEILDWPRDRASDPIVITSAEDGSGVGAAVISAMTTKRRMEGQPVGAKR